MTTHHDPGDEDHRTRRDRMLDKLAAIGDTDHPPPGYAAARHPNGSGSVKTCP